MRFSPVAFLIRGVLMSAVGIVALDLLALVLRFPAGAGLGLLVLAYRRWHRWQRSDAYGSARSSGLADLLAHGMLGDNGLVLGTCGYLPRTTRLAGIRALFSTLPSPVACRVFFAAFLGPRWLEP